MDKDTLLRLKNHTELVRELLNHPSKWTRGAYARDQKGNACSPFEPEATCYCLRGASLVAGQTFRSSSEFSKLCFETARKLGYSEMRKELLAVFNDSQWTFIS